MVGSKTYMDLLARPKKFFGKTRKVFWLDPTVQAKLENPFIKGGRANSFVKNGKVLPFIKGAVCHQPFYQGPALFHYAPCSAKKWHTASSKDLKPPLPWCDPMG